jgi:hypothetical protein
MIQKIKQIALGLAVAFGLGLVLVPTVGAVNVDPLSGACANSTGTKVCDGKNDDVSTTVTQVVNVLLFIVGVISVIMIIVGGILYSVSTGDQARITKAKFTIIYAVAGLVVALLAYAIVNFVVNRFQ